MSFHQTYEFLALDRPLSTAELAEIKGLSSHASVSPSRFAVSYDYGSFKSDPDEVLLRWFDVHFYRSPNDAQLCVKVPADLLDEDTADAFEVDGVQNIGRRGPHLLLQWRREDEGGDGWIDDNEVADEAAELAGIRAVLLRGELWPLYLGWLSGQTTSLDEDADEPGTEPPVPLGLQAGDPLCRAWADFLGVSQDVLAAVAEVSAPVPPRDERRAVLGWLGKLAPADKDPALAGVLLGDSAGDVAVLRQRFAHWRRSRVATGPRERRTVAQLEERAKVLAEARQRAEAEQEARARAEHLDAVAKSAPTLWKRVYALRESQSRSAPQQAVDTLRDLRDAADRQGARAEFDQKLAMFVGTLRPTRVLFRRLVEARLVR